MIQIDDDVYINKNNIAYIIEEKTQYVIVMTNNKKFNIDLHSCYSWKIAEELLEVE